MLALFLLQGSGIAYLLIMCLVFIIVVAVLFYLINTFLPEPLRKFGIAAIIVVSAIFLIYLLLSFVGGAPRLHF